ncbi:Protein-serine/threonine phosphatase [Heracleum sosnowskyi]|uniref:protein-serine/threonine phosphatase n=1 Tax=Heracleum sosnowskyi TaxID=360622 RepID=A0AAD8MYU6_9APIA|nr:Protein-serine/threonine phosphatase [Heracleum sosnowskyi]
MAMSRALVELTESSSSILIAASYSFLLLLMLLLILLVIFFACRPWRFFSRFLSSSRLSSRPIKAEDLERPLVSNDSDHITDFARTYNIDVASHQTEGLLNSSRNQGLAYKHRLPHTATKLALTHSDSLILDISEDSPVGQTLKRPFVTPQSGDIQKVKEDSCQLSGFGLEDKANEFVPEYSAAQRSILVLEVVSGPSHGLRYSTQSTNKSGLPLTLGRVLPSALLLKDSEVSGKHAMINWNSNKLKWDLVDMGSLNGTLLNSQSISHANSGSRHWGDPNELASGDTITLGSSSKIVVQIISEIEKIPFGVGVASDPMSLRRGGKKFPMEDVCYYQWPLHEINQFGLFGVCDGHGGAAAAVSASKLLQEIVADILADSFRRERILTKCDASDVLREAFTQTEACMDHCYEGCTATMLMVWTEDHENFYAQCANVGDSACFVNVDEEHIKMTEDHRIISSSERQRIQATGEPLKDGETRLCGLNLARMLGDKFLKQQEARFSSEPYISQVVYIHQASRAFVVLASDGFWDVVNFKKAFQLAQETKDRSATKEENTAEKIANILLSEARTQRTKDNTSILFLEFDRNNRDNHSKL